MSFFQLTPLEIQASLEFWTPARMAAATPFPFPQVNMPEGIQQKDDEFSKVEAEMSFCSSEDNSSKIRLMTLDNEILKRTGRLYFSRRDGRWGYATAQVVGRDDILMTAAYCLKEPGSEGKLSKHLVFQRSFANENYVQHMPIAITSGRVNPAWELDVLSASDRIRWDYGFVKTTRACTDGYYELGTPIPDNIKSIGYPDIYLNKYLSYVNSTRGRIEDGVACMQNNFMRSGANGGAWLLWTGGDKVFGLNGVSSNGYMFGPVFDNETQYILNQLIRGGDYRKRLCSEPYGFKK